MKRFQWFSVVVVLSCVTLACSGDDKAAGTGAGSGAGDGATGGTSGGGTSGGTSGSGSTGTSGSDAADGGNVFVGEAGGGWTAPPSILELCSGPCECSDGKDNDGDGEVDGFDIECVAAADNDEGSFATAIPGDNRDPKWQDCFFDGNSGAGDDGCKYHTDCLTGAKDDSDEDCALTDACVEFCRPLTPNGCDCFGCCDVQDDDGKTYTIKVDATCDETKLDECTTCVRSTTCENKCGECELCPGKTIGDLPESCSMTPPTAGTSGGAAGTMATAGTSGGTAGTSGTAGTTGGEDPPGYTCDGGEQVCSATKPCSGEYFCSFGCCLLIPE